MRHEHTILSHRAKQLTFITIQQDKSPFSCLHPWAVTEEAVMPEGSLYISSGE